MTSDFTSLLTAASTGRPLSADQMQHAMTLLLGGDVDPVQAGAFLMALKVRGETTDEIAAAATAMREAAIGFDGPEDAIDTCGTGGDGANTYNISTATAILLSACSVPVAKHGNKAVSSASGSSDVLTALGVNVAAGPDRAKACLKDIGLAFLFAPHHHPAVRHVAPIRAALGVRTLFNLLGPLTNPAKAKRQLLGVYDKALVRPIAETLNALGTTRAWVVHGADGLDELTVTGPTYVCALEDGKLRDFTVTPEEAGLSQHTARDLVGGDADTNAQAMHELFAGTPSAYRDAVVLNTAAGLVVAGAENDLAKAARRAEAALDEGRAAAKLNAFVEYTNK
ncbi:MAG: anthranilate phosphoribosyltransferase [Pseudomonadota bacterium]